MLPKGGNESRMRLPLRQYLQNHAQFRAGVVTNKIVVASIGPRGMSVSYQHWSNNFSHNSLGMTELKTDLSWSNVGSASVVRDTDLYLVVLKLRKPVKCFSALEHEPWDQTEQSTYAFPFTTRKEAGVCRSLLMHIVQEYGKLK